MRREFLKERRKANVITKLLQCGSEYTYEDGVLLVCPECAYEWEPGSEVEEGPVATDNGNKLQDVILQQSSKI